MIFTGLSSSQEFSSEDVDLTIRGEEEIFANEENTYEVTIGGDFGENAENWTLNSNVVEGEASVSPRSQDSNTSNIFEVDVLAIEPGTVSIEFEGLCYGDNETRREIRTWDINVLEVIKTSVIVTNPTDTVIEDVTIGLFVDSELKRSMSIEKLDADGEREIQFNWSKEGLDPGEHKIEFWVDYGFEQNEEFNKDALLHEDQIYIPDKRMHTIYNSLIILLIVGIIAGFFYYMHKRKKRRRPW